jgi:hypothetical protein
MSQRSSVQLDGPVFAQTCVFTWMHNPAAGYSQLRHTAASLGVNVTNQAIEQRFSSASARLGRALLEEAVGQLISSQTSAPELLRRFNGVYLQDGTVISLPACLAEPWLARSKRGQEAAMRGPRPGGVGLRAVGGLVVTGSPGSRTQWPGHHHAITGREPLQWG